MIKNEGESLSSQERMGWTTHQKPEGAEEK